MSDDPFYKPNLKRAPLSVGQPGEKLVEFLVGHDRYLFELRDHGEVYGVACQIFKNEDLLIAQRFDPRLDASRPSRELALQWADEMREVPREQAHAPGERAEDHDLASQGHSAHRSTGGAGDHDPA